MTHESFEQSELATGESDLIVAFTYPSRDKVHLDVGRGQSSCVRFTRAKSCSDAREQFAQCEGLDQIVVGSLIEKFHSLTDGVACSEDHDGQFGPSIAYTSQYLDTVEYGQTKIQNDQGHLVAKRQGGTTRSVTGQSDRPSFRAKSLVEELGEAAIVFDHCNEHVTILASHAFDHHILRGFSARLHVALRMSSHTGDHTNRKETDMATSTKTVAWSAVTAALVGAGTAIVVMTITDDDSSVVSPREIAGVSIITPTTQVEPLLMPSDSVPDTLTVLPEGARAVPVPTLDAGRGVVPGLQETTGTVSYERDEFRLDGRELDMGPDRWLTSTEATGDLDGNGIVETWWMELSGTVGRSVTVFGDVDDDDIDVYEINGLSVRPLYTEVAPWSDGWNAVDVPASIDE
ncbi:MAG: family unassigned peptidase, partial [Actinomycetota bacterium]